MRELIVGLTDVLDALTSRETIGEGSMTLHSDGSNAMDKTSAPPMVVRLMSKGKQAGALQFQLGV